MATATDDRPLTGRQAELIRYLMRCVQLEGCLPSYAEIMATMGFRSPNSVRSYLLSLQRKGYVRMAEQHVSRTRSYRILRDAAGNRIYRWSPIYMKEG